MILAIDGTNLRARQKPLFDELETARSSTQPIAGVCTLASPLLLAQLRADSEVIERALVGPLTTENLGIEKLIRTVVHVPSVRFLILCGQDARGHYGGQAVLALLTGGVDSASRIVGARGPRPTLANVGESEIQRFRQQVTPIDLIGCEESALVRSQLLLCEARYPGAYQANDVEEVDPKALAVFEVAASYDPYRDWVRDPSGYFLVEVEREVGGLKCEHYLNSDMLHAVIRGASAAEVLHTIVQYQLVSRLDHATYLGRELQKAEFALRHGLTFEQDATLSMLARV